MRLLLLAVGLGLCSGTHAQIIAYIQDSETLLQQMPAYQEEWAVLKGYEAELEVVLVAKQKAIQDYYTSVMKQERRSCGMPPKWYTEVEDSLQRAQEALSAMVCEADLLLEARKNFLYAFVKDEWKCAVETLAKQQGYNLIVEHTVLGYGVPGMDATTQLQLILEDQEEGRALPLSGERLRVKGVVYVKQPDSLIAKMPAYQAAQVELAAYAQQLRAETEAGMMHYRQKAEDFVESFQRICSTPGAQIAAQDSLNAWQAISEGLQEREEEDLAARRVFVHAFVVDEFECAVETLSRYRGYRMVLDGRQVIYGEERLNIAPLLHSLLGIQE